MSEALIDEFDSLDKGKKRIGQISKLFREFWVYSS